MKSLFVMLFVALFSINVFAQQLAHPCHGGFDNEGNLIWKKEVGVEIRASGFENRVEAETFSAAVMNRDLRRPEAPFCLVPSVRGSERKLVVRVELDSYRTKKGRDKIEKEIIRGGVNLTLDPLLKLIFSDKKSGNYRKRETVKEYIQIFGGEYTNQPDIKIRPYFVTAETVMYEGSKILWEGSSTRMFFVKETDYRNDVLPDATEIIGATVEIKDLMLFYGLKDIPSFTNLDFRTEQIMGLMAARDALQPKNIRHNVKVEALPQQNTTGGGN